MRYAENMYDLNDTFKYNYTLMVGLSHQHGLTRQWPNPDSALSLMALQELSCSVQAALPGSAGSFIHQGMMWNDYMYYVNTVKMMEDK